MDVFPRLRQFRVGYPDLDALEHAFPGGVTLEAGNDQTGRNPYAPFPPLVVFRVGKPPLRHRIKSVLGVPAQHDRFRRFGRDAPTLQQRELFRVAQHLGVAFLDELPRLLPPQRRRRLLGAGFPLPRHGNLADGLLALLPALERIRAILREKRLEALRGAFPVAVHRAKNVDDVPAVPTGIAAAGVVLRRVPEGVSRRVLGVEGAVRGKLPALRAALRIDQKFARDAIKFINRQIFLCFSHNSSLEQICSDIVIRP